MGHCGSGASSLAQARLEGRPPPPARSDRLTVAGQGRLWPRCPLPAVTSGARQSTGNACESRGPRASLPGGGSVRPAPGTKGSPHVPSALRGAGLPSGDGGRAPCVPEASGGCDLGGVTAPARALWRLGLIASHSPGRTGACCGGGRLVPGSHLLEQAIPTCLLCARVLQVEGWGPFDLVYGSTPPVGHACDHPPGRRPRSAGVPWPSGSQTHLHAPPSVLCVPVAGAPSGVICGRTRTCAPHAVFTAQSPHNGGGAVCAQATETRALEAQPLWRGQACPGERRAPGPGSHPRAPLPRPHGQSPHAPGRPSPSVVPAPVPPRPAVRKAPAGPPAALLLDVRGQSGADPRGPDRSHSLPGGTCRAAVRGPVRGPPRDRPASSEPGP